MASKVRGTNTRLAAMWTAIEPQRSCGIAADRAVIASGSRTAFQRQAATTPIARRPRTMKRAARRKPIDGSAVAAPPALRRHCTTETLGGGRESVLRIGQHLVEEMRPSGSALQPNHAEKIDDADPEPVENAVFRAPPRRGRWLTGTERTIPPSRNTSAGRNRCMWSKYGRSRKSARGNSFKPHPVSGVSSASNRRRTALAICDAERFVQLSCRSSRCPAINSGGPPARCGQMRHNVGMSAGSFWPSPSSVAIQAARAALTPVRMAALCPQLRVCRSSRKRGSCGLKPRDLGGGRILAAVIDIDDLIIQQAVERCANLANERHDVGRLVPYRDDD